MNRNARSFVVAVILLVVSACGSQPSQPENPTPVYVPVIVTVGIPVPVTVTPSEESAVVPSDGSTQISITQALNAEDIEEDGQKWHVFEDKGTPLWILQNADSPALKGKSLQCSLTGGTEYSGAHCYREFDAIPQASSFRLDLSFQFTPATTCNNEGEASVVQAIEFSMSKWEQSQRYELAVQWNNVGEGAPQWRYWDPSKANEKWTPINSNVRHCLESDQWHTLTLDGDIVDGQVHYKSFTIDNSTQNLDISVPPAPASNERDRLAVAVQVNGNAAQTPYDLFIDNVNFDVGSMVDCNAIAALQSNTEFTFNYLQTEQVQKGNTEVVVHKIEKNTKITWEPACLMDLQYYLDGAVIFERLDARSGAYDLSGNEIPTAEDIEIKIWIPGTETNFSSWVSVIPDQ